MEENQPVILAINGFEFARKIDFWHLIATSIHRVSEQEIKTVYLVIDRPKIFDLGPYGRDLHSSFGDK